MAVLESHNGYYLWKYLPSVPAAIIFLLLFITLISFHAWKMIKQKPVEVIGYISRCIAHNATGKLIPFILLAPALFAASIYMVLGRIIRSVRGEQHWLIRVHWLTRAFVLGDVLSFMIQDGDAGLMVTGDNVALWNDIVIASLAIHVLSFGLFICTAIHFQYKIEKFPTRESVVDEDMPWKKNLWGLYGMSIFVLIRSVFRVVEYSLGYDGYALRHEWTLYVFDAVPMVGVMVIFAVWYPSQLRLPPKDGEVGRVELVQLHSVLVGGK